MAKQHAPNSSLFIVYIIFDRPRIAVVVVVYYRGSAAVAQLDKKIEDFSTPSPPPLRVVSELDTNTILRRHGKRVVIVLTLK